MGTYRFENHDQLHKVFDCRYAKRKPCEGDCPLGVAKGVCEAGFFLCMEGRPACGDRVEIGDIAIETRETPDGDYEVIKEGEPCSGS